jgi:hypothetical protein
MESCLAVITFCIEIKAQFFTIMKTCLMKTCPAIIVFCIAMPKVAAFSMRIISTVSAGRFHNDHFQQHSEEVSYHYFLPGFGLKPYSLGVGRC